jgi:hypothetical protein
MVVPMGAYFTSGVAPKFLTGGGGERTDVS